MKFNVGTIDRVLRVVVGIVLMTLAATGIVGLWGWLGVILLLTGAISFCPLYAIFGMNTCPAKK